MRFKLLMSLFCAVLLAACGGGSNSGRSDSVGATTGSSTTNGQAGGPEPTVPSAYTVARVLLNQGARAYDSERHAEPVVPVVAGRDLLIRVFVTGSGPVPDGRAVLRFQNGTQRSFSLLEPTAIGPQAADESILGASHYVIVPASEVAAGASLTVEGG